MWDNNVCCSILFFNYFSICSFHSWSSLLLQWIWHLSNGNQKYLEQCVCVCLSGFLSASVCACGWHRLHVEHYPSSQDQVWGVLHCIELSRLRPWWETHIWESDSRAFCNTEASLRTTTRTSVIGAKWQQYKSICSSSEKSNVISGQIISGLTGIIYIWIHFGNMQITYT